MNVGLVGIGFMGMMHYLAYQKVRGAKVTAIAARDEKKLAEAHKVLELGKPSATADDASLIITMPKGERLRFPQPNLGTPIQVTAMHEVDFVRLFPKLRTRPAS